jgi:hypothetical protein
MIIIIVNDCKNNLWRSVHFILDNKSSIILGLNHGQGFVLFANHPRANLYFRIDFRPTAGPIPTAPPAAPPLPPAQPMASIPVAAIRHAQAMEAPVHAPPPPVAPAGGAAPVVKMPPADPTKEIAGTRSEHRVLLLLLLFFKLLFLFWESAPNNIFIL